MGKVLAGYRISQSRYFMKTIFVAGLVVLTLLPLDYLQYRLLGWSAFPPVKVWLLDGKFGNFDSWMPMRAALNSWQTKGGTSLYEQIFFTRHIKFQYPPTSLLPFWGLRAIGVDTTDIFLNKVSRILVAMNALGIGFLFRLLLIRSPGRGAAASLAGLAATVLVTLATLTFYPIMMGYWLGQIQVWVDTLFTLACIAVFCDRDLTAGLSIGLICLLKPQFAVFVVWAVLRRRRRFLIGCVLVLLPCGLLSLSLFSVRANIDYLRELGFLSRHGEALIVNNSMNGIFNDLLETASAFIWDGSRFPPYNAIVYTVSVLTAAALNLAAFWPWAGQRGA